MVASDGAGEYEVVGEARAGVIEDMSLQAGQVAYITTGRFAHCALRQHVHALARAHTHAHAHTHTHTHT